MVSLSNHDLGFNRENADTIFGIGIADYNARSLRAFRKAGFAPYDTVAEPPGVGRPRRYYVALTKESYSNSRASVGDTKLRP